MKELMKKYLKPGLIVCGLLITAYFGMQAAQIRLNPPVIEQVEGADATEVAAAEATFEKARTVWNNQFARKGFFTLIGLFLALVGLLPKKKIWIPKIVFSTGLVALIIHHLLADGKIASIAADGLTISIFWLVAAFIVKGTGMACTVWRWKVLLEGQGFKIPLRHLIESFLIGRFIGSFAPGTSGLDGYRAYDISRYTGKIARSISVIVVEKLIGFFVLGTLLLISVPVGQRLFAANQVNTTAITMMGLAFSGMMIAALLFLFKPGIFRWFVAKFIPARSPIRGPIEKALGAVTAYEKRKLQLAKATLIGFGVHVCTIGMYFCTARSIGEFPLTGDLFVTGALMIGATILPLSIAGIGMREGVFVFFLGPIAALYAFGGYLVGEIISLFGGPVWLARRGDYYEVIKAQRGEINKDVEDEEEELPSEALPEVSDDELPKILDYAIVGAGAGLLAGASVAIVDSARLWLLASSGLDWSLPGYGALLYGPLLGVFGAFAGAALAILGRIARTPAAPPVKLSTFVGGVLFYVFTLAIGFFYLKRDVFGEKAGLMDPKMLGSLVAFAVGLLLLVVGKSYLARRFGGALGKTLANKFVYPVMYLAITGVLLVAWAVAPATGAGGGATRGDASGAKGKPNIVLVMADTLRADYVGAYGSEQGLTPNLDQLAAEGGVYLNAFAQASWTRPSVATLLTGRYPSSHTSTLKGSLLPEKVTTLSEVLVETGYETLGIASNYNLTPFFNYDQGFVDYRYLTPNLPFGSTDAQSKLIFIEVAKKVAARFKGKRETPEDYYVIGEEVTRVSLDALDQRDKDRPFFLFTTYMDPHDPYFRHPFDGYGISQRAHPHPDPSMIPEMKELYAGEVKYWDQTFGALIDGLKQRGLYDDTLIVVTSDHGEEFGEHGGFWHGKTLYEEQLRIVHIAKFPAAFGISGGTKLGEWTGLVDVAPKILNLVDLKVPAEMQGVANHKTSRDPVFAEEDHEGNVLSSILYLSEDGAPTKLIQANEGNPRGLETLELYQVDRDPAEQDNLASKDRNRVLEAVKTLDEAAIRAREGAVKAQTGELSTEAQEQLKRLGYFTE